MTEGGDEEFYKNFEALGYSKSLVADEVATYNITVAAEKTGYVCEKLPIVLITI